MCLEYTTDTHGVRNMTQSDDPSDIYFSFV